jgi:hypothetical protein
VPLPDGGETDADIQLPTGRDAGGLEGGATDSAPELDVGTPDAPTIVDGGQD